MMVPLSLCGEGLWSEASAFRHHFLNHEVIQLSQSVEIHLIEMNLNECSCCISRNPLNVVILFFPGFCFGLIS